MTLIELLIVVSMAALLLVATMAYSVPWLEKENVRGAVYDMQTHIQLARIEAVSRNRDCRFVIDTADGSLEVFDSNGTAALGDDTLLYDDFLDDEIAFERPDLGAAVTLSQIGASSEWQVVFNSDGTVDLGTGAVVIHGGPLYGRVTVFGAGGVQVERWDGSAWHTGT